MKSKETTPQYTENTVSIREFARCAAVSDTAIRKAITAGRISASSTQVNPTNDRPELLYEKALRDWLAAGGKMNKTPQFLNKQAFPLTTLEALTIKENDAPTLFDASTQETKPDKIIGEGVGEYAMANTRAVVLKTKLMEIELAQKEGVLVNKEKVYKKLFDFGSQLRSKILSIPDRTIDDIFSSSDRNQAHTKLLKALTEALQDLTTGVDIT